MLLDDIKRSYAQDLDEPIAGLCLHLVDSLAHVPPKQLRRISLAWLASIADRKWDDDEFQAALTALTTSRLHPLTMYFVWHDRDEDREVAFSAGDVMRAVEETVFIHPRTGEEIPDFERELTPVLRASDAFMQFLEGHER